MPGSWQRYYRRRGNTTREEVESYQAAELLPPLAKLAPPATVIEKSGYSAFVEPHLRKFKLIIPGSETGACVLATVLGAVDLGYRVILVRERSAVHPTKAMTPSCKGIFAATTMTIRSKHSILRLANYKCWPVAITGTALSSHPREHRAQIEIYPS